MSRQVDIAIIGGGIAGLSAAVTAARKGWKTLIVAGGIPGGQLLNIEKVEGVPGFPEGIAGFDLGPMIQEQADAAGAELMMANCHEIQAVGARWSLKSDDQDVSARAVILATGTAFAKLGVDGEERLFGKGVSECASCDAPLFRDKTAVVVGGGDSALQETLTLVEHLSKVIILERDEGLTAQAVYQDRIGAIGKIEVRTQATVTAILGDDAVSGVRVKDLAGGTETDLATAAVFVFVGQVPNSDFVKSFVPLDATGRVIVDSAMRTSVRGICAAGNIREFSPHRAAGAMGDGAAAAMALDRYLKGGEWR
jgi:thioredoxin reductase (NADPH)